MGLNVIVALIALVTLSPTALSVATGGSGGATISDAGNDFVFTVAGDGATINKFDLRLTRFTDSNNNGDFLDDGDTSVRFELLGAASCVNIAVHVSCGISDSHAFVVWKKGSSEQIPGNYSLTIITRTNLNAVITATSWAIKLQGENPFQNGIISQFERTREQINKTDSRVSDNITAESQGTRNLINQSYTNVTGNISVDILNHTVLRNSLGNACHGADFCLNNHITTVHDTDLYRAVGIFVWLALIVVITKWLHIHKLMVAIMAILPIVYVMANLDAFSPELMIAIIMACIGVFVALQWTPRGGGVPDA